MIGKNSALPPALVRLATPDHHLLVGEPVECLIHPPDASSFELRLTAGVSRELRRWRSETNRVVLDQPLEPGLYAVSAQCLDAKGNEVTARSVPLRFQVYSESERDLVQALRRREHLLTLLVTRDARYAWTIIDPWALPPDCPSGAGWFRSPVYEGRTSLLNEVEDYYRDPRQYFVRQIDAMVAAGRHFITWHDLLDGPAPPPEIPAALVQFDVDGGPRSMARLIPQLLERGVRASVMIHREAHGWYDQTLDDLPLGLLAEAESAGWAIGYHCNTVGTAQGQARAGDYGEEVMAEAVARFVGDVAALRELFDIRTWTAHGGNVLNHRIEPPEIPGLRHVDRVAAELWQPIRSMFSDGGFLSRPGPLSEHVAKLGSGLHFLRIHPFKYGNYEPPWDGPPLHPSDWETLGVPPEERESLATEVDRELGKQKAWLDHRRRHRSGPTLSRLGPRGALSQRFAPWEQVRERVERFRARRRESLLREYPAPQGDARVFWWRLIEVFGPDRGSVLNVGALPPAMRDEQSAFLSPGVEVVELDTDPSREPHILGDICGPHPQLESKFAGVFLFGLPYFPSPGAALSSCWSVTEEGGVALFGFPDETHPRRGAMWHAGNRPVWRPELEPLADIGLRGNLWCFDERGLEQLLGPWRRSAEIENFTNYWFVRAEKRS